MTDWKRRRKLGKEMVRQLKEQPCADCGRTYPFYVMDLDHRDPGAKVEDVSKLAKRGVPMGQLRKEMEKCDVVCANCHRIRGWKAKHHLYRDGCLPAPSISPQSRFWN